VVEAISQRARGRKGFLLKSLSPPAGDRLSTRHPLSMADNLDIANAEGESAALPFFD